MKLAKEAFRSGDRVQSEYYYQFTDHYFRLMVEMGINIEDNTINDDTKISTNEQILENESSNSSETEESSSDQESIESIPFIADPSKEKRTRSSK